MKAFKKLSMLFVAVAMMMTTVSTAFAAGNAEDVSNGTLKINGENRTYKAYRVLDGSTKHASKDVDLFKVNKHFDKFFQDNEKGITFDSSEGIKLNDTLIDGNDFDFVRENADDYPKQDENKVTLTTAFVSYLQEHSDSKDVANYISFDTVNIESTKTTTLPQGLYLILDTAETVDNEGGNSKRVPSKPMLVKISPNKLTEINPKDAKINIVKTADGSDKNVAGIGDTIAYKITSTIPTYGPDYTDIELRVSDTLSKGLTYKGGLVVKFNNVTVYDEAKGIDSGVLIFNGTEGKTTTIPAIDTKGASLNIEFNYENVKQYVGQEIEVTYNAEINDEASIGVDTNTNNANLIYTNDPNGGTTAIKTHTDTYTYGLGINKVDGNDKTKPVVATFGIYSDSDCKNLIHEITTTDGYDEFKGLGEGDFYIKENSVEGKYALLDGTIHINVKHVDSDFSTADITIVDANGEIADFLDKNKPIENGMIKLQILNYQGINLPETGGMGTTIFMIGGAALIALAGVMLVVYSKKSKKA